MDVDTFPDPVRRLGLVGACLLLALGPTVLAFFTGGYFEGPRAWAGAGAWLLVLIGAVLRARARPPAGVAAIAPGGLAALAALSLVSMLWAPEVSNAYQASQIVVLYLGTILAAGLLLHGPVARLVEPLLAAGALIVIGYGLSERFLPGVLQFARSTAAEGRLEQPLTYWNAMGELAALGLVLATRIAGDEARPGSLRRGAAAAVVPLGMGLYVSFSRGALFAAGAGLLALLAAAPRRQQLAAVLAAVVFGVLGGAAAAPFAGVTAMSGPISTRETQGAIALAILAVLMLAAAVVAGWLAARVAAVALALPPRAPAIAAGLVCAGLAAAIILGAKESSTANQALSGGSSRLVTLQSNRFDYWRVALRAFATQPLRGVGAGNWSVYWLRWRTISEGAQDAHSLPLQTLAELGVLGVLALATFVAGIAVAAARALRRTPLAAGPIAALVTYAVHAPLDWDWQMPAVTLPAMVLAGMILALATAGDERARAGAVTAPRRSGEPRARTPTPPGHRS